MSLWGIEIWARKTKILCETERQKKWATLILIEDINVQRDTETKWMLLHFHPMDPFRIVIFIWKCLALNLKLLTPNPPTATTKVKVKQKRTQFSRLFLCGDNEPYHQANYQANFVEYHFLSLSLFLSSLLSLPSALYRHFVLHCRTLTHTHTHNTQQYTATTKANESLFGWVIYFTANLHEIWNVNQMFGSSVCWNSNEVG